MVPGATAEHAVDVVQTTAMEQPGCERVRSAIRQQVDDPAPLKVADDRAVACTAPPCPVVDANDVRQGRADIGGLGPDHPQQRAVRLGPGGVD